MQHVARESSQLLRDYVEGRDVACPTCSYNLRNTTSERCPECGAVLQLRVNTPHVRAGAWIVALLAAALPLGFNLTMLGVAGYAVHARARATAQGPFQPYPPLSAADYKLMAGLAGASVAYTVLLFVATRVRQWLALRTTAARTGIVLVWTGMLLTMHVVVLNWMFRALDSFW